MSDPDDSPDLRLTLPTGSGPRLLPGFQLHMHLDVPRLEWRTVRSYPEGDGTTRPLDSPEPLIEASRYFADGSFLLNASRPNWLILDKAFGGAPLAPPRALASFAELQAATNEAFYRRLGRTPPLFGAPANNALGLPQLPITGPAPTPWFKLPDPHPSWFEPPAPRPGAVGDILSGISKLPAVQSLLNTINEEGKWRLHEMARNWNNSALIDKLGFVTLAAPLAAGIVGGVLGADDARHKAFGLLKGADIPVPFVGGLKFKINDFGRLDPFLLGAPRADPNRPAGYEVIISVDLMKVAPRVFSSF